MRTISNLIIKLILKVWNVVMVLSRVSRRGVVGHHDHLAARSLNTRNAWDNSK